MTTIKDITPTPTASIENVSIRQGATLNIAILESTDRMALMVAVCTAIESGCEFVSGTDTTATLRKGEAPTLPFDDSPVCTECGQQAGVSAHGEWQVRGCDTCSAEICFRCAPMVFCKQHPGSGYHWHNDWHCAS